MQTAYLKTRKIKAPLAETAVEPFSGFILWWYKTIPLTWIDVFTATVSLLLDKLSISLLLTTFFTPWHRDRTVIGRAFGILMRIVYLPFALLAFLLIVLPLVAFLIIWLALPVSPLLVVIFQLIYP